MYTKSNSRKRKSKLNSKSEGTVDNKSPTLQKIELRRSTSRLRQRLVNLQSNPEDCVAVKHSDCSKGTQQCEKCGKNFISKISLDRHISRFHIVDVQTHDKPDEKQTSDAFKGVQSIRNKKFECLVCSVTFSLENSLKRHQKKMHSVIVGVSNFGSSSQYNFENENEKETNETNSSIVPNIFEESSSRVHDEDDINEGEKISEIETLECAECPEKFSSKRALILHLRRVHNCEISACNNFTSQKTFKCLECPITFSRCNSLTRHQKKFHPCPKQKHLDDLLSSKTFACSKCSAMFTRKCNLRRHEKQFHFDPVLHGEGKKIIECASCNSKFTAKGTLMKHIRQFHASTIEPKLTIEHKTVECPRCFVRFSRKTNLLRHEKKFHPEKFEQSGCTPSRRPILCPVCKVSYNKKTQLLAHFGDAHDIQLKEEFFIFGNEAEFKKWRISVEEENKCNYMTRHSVLYGEYKKVILRCSRSGHYEAKAQNRQRRLKEKGSKKINGHCPAEMNVKIYNDGTVRVHHQATHVGHSKELKYMDLNEEERNIIVNTLASGVPVNSLLELFRINSSTPLEHRKRLHLISKKEIRNVAHRAGVFNTSSKIRLKEEPIRVEDWVKANEQFVLYFKWTGTFDEEFPSLNKEDFMLIIMTSTLQEKLRRYGNNVLYFDSTHGANQFNFQLSALMVLNEMEREYPCAFMFSNKMDEEFYHVFIECIMKKVPTLRPKIIMTDMTESFYEAWAQIMPEPKFRLYCTWHVLKDWKANLTKIQWPEKRKQVLKSLEDLLYLADEESFKAELDKFLEPGKGYEDFQKYFMEEFLLKRSPKSWAYCYRYMSNVKLSMNLEAFHKNIKNRVHGGKDVKFLEEALLGLEKYLTEKEHEDVLIQEGCIQPPNQIGYKLRMLRKRHQEIQNVTVEHIECAVENKIWFLTSSTIRTVENPKERENCEQSILTIFSIEKTYTDCSVLDCPMKCDECNVCIHMFKCSCEDCSMKGNMCKHIHLVCQYIRIHTPELLPEIIVPDVSTTVVASEISTTSRLDHEDECSSSTVNSTSVRAVPLSRKEEKIEVTSTVASVKYEEEAEEMMVEENVDDVEAKFIEIFKEIRKNPNEKRQYLNMLKKTAVAFSKCNTPLK